MRQLRASRKPRLTDQQEKEVRRRAFKERQAPEAICKEFGITRSLLYRICGGPINGQTIERAYAG